MDIEQYLRQLENACNKSIAAAHTHGRRGAKIQQLRLVKEIRSRLTRLEELENELRHQGDGERRP